MRRTILIAAAHLPGFGENLSCHSHSLSLNQLKMVKLMNIQSFKYRFLGAALFVLTALVEMFAQMPPVKVPSKAKKAVPRQAPQLPQEDNTWWYLTLLLLLLGLGAAIYVWYTKKKAAQGEGKESKEELPGWEEDALDADAELEWFRKKTRKKKEAQPSEAAVKKKKTKRKLEKLEQREKRNKLEQRRFQQLPITLIHGLKPETPYEPLDVSDDKGLLSAVEQAQDEFEEDISVREVALRVLAKFRTKNSVEALTQIALYDVAAGLRSSAVGALADFDHQSVFEAILLSCADPTREVRAAAARALFKLSFDRAEAWARIARCGDDFRIVRAARAAIESELVDRSIDRLVHDDERHAYEAFALVALLVEAGETKELFEVIENNRNKSVKLAVFHCLKVLQNPATLPDLYTYIERNSLPEDLSNAANEVIRSFELVPA